MATFKLSDVGVNEIGVMEIEVHFLDKIENSLLDCGFQKVYKFLNKNEVIDAARNNKVKYFILDVHMGEKRPQEGLDALEILKLRIDSDLFVCILSGYNGRIKQQARKLNVDLFQSKSAETKKDVAYITQQILEHKKKQIEKIEFSIAEEYLKPNSIPKEKEDVNVSKFNEYKKNKQWFKQYENMYVGFVDGKFVGHNKGKKTLIVELTQKFPHNAKFVSRVQKKDEVIDLPSSLLIDNVK